MNTVMENLLTRRSIRAFEDREIPGQELDAILKAAQYAPSAMNRQTWQFTVLRSRAKIQELAAGKLDLLQIVQQGFLVRNMLSG